MIIQRIFPQFGDPEMLDQTSDAILVRIIKLSSKSWGNSVTFTADKTSPLLEPIASLYGIDFDPLR